MTDDETATILLVEDDDATRTFLADNLSADGYELLVADCVSDGLRLLERKFPDLALVDLGLPDASGYELLRRVRCADGVASRVDRARMLRPMPEYPHATRHARPTPPRIRPCEPSRRPCRRQFPFARRPGQPRQEVRHRPRVLSLIHISEPTRPY